jgi:hypothetical protein
LYLKCRTVTRYKETAIKNHKEKTWQVKKSKGRHHRRGKLRLVPRTGRPIYKNAKKDENIPGIMHTQLGDYHVKDIEFTLGIDVNATKVGKDLSEAIFAEPNNTYKFSMSPTSTYLSCAA